MRRMRPVAPLMGQALARANVHRMCTNKRVYKADATARASARALGLRAYECPFCTWWHLTSKEGS